jgi:hypothetical protein
MSRAKYSKLLLIIVELNLVAGHGRGTIMFISAQWGDLLSTLMAGKKLNDFIRTNTYLQQLHA